MAGVMGSTAHGSSGGGASGTGLKSSACQIVFGGVSGLRESTLPSLRSQDLTATPPCCALYSNYGRLRTPVGIGTALAHAALLRRVRGGWRRAGRHVHEADSNGLIGGVLLDQFPAEGAGEERRSGRPPAAPAARRTGEASSGR